MPSVTAPSMLTARFILSTIVLFAFSSCPAQMANLHLIPMPREVEPLSDVALVKGLRVLCKNCDSDDQFAADELVGSIKARGIPVTQDGFDIALTRESKAGFSAAMHAEGYEIGVSGHMLTVTAETHTGLFYGAQTVKQLIDGSGSKAILHTASIRDWPAMKYRGLHDDLSRGPIPTLAFQKHLIQVLAAYKVNVYSPYFEHTQQFRSTPITAPPAGSITPDEARELSIFASKYHVNIVPEQEAFGHLRHALIWEQFSKVAETPHGAVLAPGQPETLQLIKSWFSELVQDYPNSGFLHIGADETVDLGVGQTKSDVDSRGRAVVYLDFLQQIVTVLQPLHRRVLFWGDVAQDAPAQLKAMPQSFKNATIAIAWGYTPDPHGFENALRPFLDAGIETWVAPSLNNYRQVYPNFNLGLPDIQQFTRDGQRLGAPGQLNTLWNDDGESLADQNWYGVLFGAAAAWQAGESSIPIFQAAFGPVFHGDLTGKVNQAQEELLAAMDILSQAKVIAATEGSDGLFWLDPWSLDGQKCAARMRPINSALRLHAEKGIQLIAEARAEYPRRRQDTELKHTGSIAEYGEHAAQTAYSYADPADPLNAYPSAPTTLREPNALDALEFGARRIDFLGMKFQLADEINEGYQRALIAQASTDPKIHRSVSRELSDINGVNGRIQDIKDSYAQLRDLFAQTWLRTNRPSGLRIVLEHYDHTIDLWLDRMERVRIAQRQFAESKTLPPSADIGLPPSNF